MGRYLVTTMAVVPRGTEGAVSLTGTIAGFVASIFLAYVGYAINMVKKSTLPSMKHSFHASVMYNNLYRVYASDF